MRGGCQEKAHGEGTPAEEQHVLSVGTRHAGRLEDWAVQWDWVGEEIKLEAWGMAMKTRRIG